MITHKAVGMNQYSKALVCLCKGFTKALVITFVVEDGTIQKSIMEAVRTTDPVLPLILNSLLDDPLMNADEPPHKDAGKSCWPWTFVTISTVLFVIGLRTKKVLNTIGFL